MGIRIPHAQVLRSTAFFHLPRGTPFTDSSVGRTPPLLCMDLRDYDPTDPGPNVLCDPPSRTLRPDGHRHDLTQVNALSKLPEYTTISMDRPYTVASICEECRMHISLTVDPTQGGYNETRPCPSSDNPLHHLYYCPDESRPIYPASREHWEDMRAFRCTGKECPIKVTVTTKPALVTERLKALLMDKPTLRERQNRFIQMHKDKVDEATKTRTDELPGKALETMVSYLKNACQGNSRKIPRENMRYNNFLADECAELFQLAGFQSSPVGYPELYCCSPI